MKATLLLFCNTPLFVDLALLYVLVCNIFKNPFLLFLWTVIKP